VPHPFTLSLEGLALLALPALSLEGSVEGSREGSFLVMGFLNL
jgi:hypothetical protein